MRKIFLILCMLYACSSMFGQENILKFQSGTFKILQFTDLHVDSKSPNTSETLNTIKRVLEMEQPQFVVLTGDVITEKPAEAGWKSVADEIEKTRTPFAINFGNHDGEVMDKHQIIEYLKRYTFFIGEYGPKEVSGVGNQVLPIMSSDGKRTAALIYLLDSHDYGANQYYGHYDWIHADQINWYRDMRDNYMIKNGNKALPSVAFFHIPIPEYKEIVNSPTRFGNFLDEGVASPEINSGLFSAFVEKGDMMGTFVGHDHNNDFIAQYYGIALGYGRATGKDAYGKMVNGGRVIELKENHFAFDTWITTPQKREGTYYYPSGITSVEEDTATYLPGVKLNKIQQGVAYTYYQGNFKSISEMLKMSASGHGNMKDFDISQSPQKDHFGYDFTAFLKIEERGIYNFYLVSDDGAKLLIDDQLVIDNDGSHSAKRATGRVALDGGFHKIRVLYFENYMGEELQVGISSKHILEQPLPDKLLYIEKK